MRAPIQQCMFPGYQCVCATELLLMSETKETPECTKKHNKKRGMQLRRQRGQEEEMVKQAEQDSWTSESKAPTKAMERNADIRIKGRQGQRMESDHETKLESINCVVFPFFFSHIVSVRHYFCLLLCSFCLLLVL